MNSDSTGNMLYNSQVQKDLQGLRKDVTVDRKELKKRARVCVRKHYFKLVFVCMLAALLGVEYTNTFELIGAYRVASRETESLAENGALSTGASVNSGNSGVWSYVLSADIPGALETVQKRFSMLQEEVDYIGSIELGHSRGVFASIVNLFSSGQISMLVVTMVDTITGSTTMTVTLLSILGFVIALSVFLFIMNVYRVTMKRVFLEARLYDEIPAGRFLYIYRIRKWFQASLSMLLYIFLGFLSLSSIVFYPFARYMLFLVPYIVAENPGIGPIAAIRLSYRMMKGHKREAFILECTMLGWRLLSFATGGLAGIFFVNTYIESTLAEYYVAVRKAALENAVPGTELLLDRYLFEKPPYSVLSGAYAETIALMQSYEPPERRQGRWEFVTRNLGIIPHVGKRERAYRLEARKQLQIQDYQEIVEGKIYPARLSPYIEKHLPRIPANIDYMRHYSVPVLILMFFVFCFFGWSWEVTLHLLEYGTFVNRGVLHGPWLPIYGSGGCLILTLLYRLRDKPKLEFAAIVVLCGIVEYFTSYFLELRYGQKWWDYSGYFLNLNGRICAEGLLVFGLGGIVVVYFVAPAMDDILSQFSIKVIAPVCIFLVTIFALDNVYSRSHPNTGEGVTDINAGGSVEMQDISQTERNTYEIAD